MTTPIPALPDARQESDWFATFAMQLRSTEDYAAWGGAADVVLLGDSITQGWQWAHAFNAIRKNRKVLNYGIGGDRTEHLLWRIRNGLLNGLQPRFVVLKIGVNNLFNGHLAADVAAGIIAVAAEVRLRVPKAKVIHYGIAPVVGEHARLEPLALEANRLVTVQIPDVRDLRLAMTGADGRIQTKLFPDGVHFSGAGYEAWAKDLLPLLG